jgi:hypothetical protein
MYKPLMKELKKKTKYKKKQLSGGAYHVVLKECPVVAAIFELAMVIIKKILAQSGLHGSYDAVHAGACILWAEGRLDYCEGCPSKCAKPRLRFKFDLAKVKMEQG